VGHIGQRHFALMVVAEHVDADAVADEDHVDAGLGLDPRGGGVIGGDHDDFLAAPLHVQKL
jgi:hypothetical protein